MDGFVLTRKIGHIDSEIRRLRYADVGWDAVPGGEQDKVTRDKLGSHDLGRRSFQRLLSGCHCAR
jgi:hypothetical protein